MTLHDANRWAVAYRSRGVWGSGVAMRSFHDRAGVTLVELMVTLLVVSILASLSLTGLAVARTTAKRAKTSATIRKISEIVLPYYEEYETRRPSISPTDEAAIIAMPGGRSLLTDLKRVAIRRLMALELPERIRDLNVDLSGSYATDWTGAVGGRSVTLTELPPVARRYRSLVAGANAPADLVRAGKFDSGELLHLIITRGPAADPDIVSHFRADEVGDPDGDGIIEFIDGWNRSINFKRWPIGFLSPMQPIDGTQRNIDPVVASDGHRLVPLVYSAGLDGSFNINEQVSVVYGTPRGGGTGLDFNPFAFNRATNASLLTDTSYSGPPFPTGSTVLIPIRRNGNAPVTFLGTPVDASGQVGNPTPPQGCTAVPSAAFVTVGSPTGPAASDNIHNHDMTR